MTAIFYSGMLIFIDVHLMLRLRRRNILILMDFPFGYKISRYTLKLILPRKKSLRHCSWGKFIAFERFSNFHMLLSENFLQIVCLWIYLLHVKLRTWYKRYWISLSLKLNFANVPRIVENASFKSINLIKSDFITGNLNPCWMKFSWRAGASKRVRARMEARKGRLLNE